jgi:6-phosphofructokinase 1
MEPEEHIYNEPSGSLKDLIGFDLTIKRLGDCRYESDIKYSSNPMEAASSFVPEDEKIISFNDSSIIEYFMNNNKEIPAYEKAGARKKLYFKPGSTVSAVVTCGGLCPGLNSVIRGIVMMNYYRYGNQTSYGIKYGYAGFIKENNYEAVLLTPGIVEDIHTKGGTILGTSRGPQDTAQIVDRLVELNVNILYTIGGDGTMRGAISILNEVRKRDLKIAIIGIPKTIDNDIDFIDRSFGMETAFSEACNSIYSAHIESRAAINGIGIVKVMGRESGFIAAYATLATNDVNFCLVPELDLELEGENGFLKHLEERLLRRHHAVIVIAEGTGQKFVTEKGNERYDASGNIIFGDIGLFLKDKIYSYLKSKNIPTSIKYLDPSYSIRSCAPTPNDSIFCSQLAQMAVHAGMTGRTGLVAGYCNGQFIHLPMELAVLKKKKIELHSQLWYSVLEATGQPVSFR